MAFTSGDDRTDKADSESVTCSNTGFSVDVVKPSSYFTPYVQYYRGDADCTVTLTSSDTYRITFNSLTACGLSSSGGGGTYSTTVVVPVRSDGLETASDILKYVTCNFPGTRSIAAAANAFGVNIANNPSNNISNTIRTPGVRVLVLNANDVPLASGQTVTLGTELELRFELTDDSDGVYGSIKVVHVYVAPTSDESDSESKQLIDEDGCPLDTSLLQAVTKLTDGTPTANARTAHADFTAFKFSSSNQVYFRATVLVCPYFNGTSCEPASCSGTTSGYGRKRREIDIVTSNGSTTISTTEIHATNVINVRTRRTGIDDTGGQTGFCLSTPGFAAAASVFIATALCCVILFVCLVVTIHRRRRQNEKIIERPAEVDSVHDNKCNFPEQKSISFPSLEPLGNHINCHQQQQPKLQQQQQQQQRNIHHRHHHRSNKQLQEKEQSNNGVIHCRYQRQTPDWQVSEKSAEPTPRAPGETSWHSFESLDTEVKQFPGFTSLADQRNAAFRHSNLSL
ncbi:uncharacterized protein LOC106161810 [Lingula anatina]|uniref:Uncharacterized protein LOC106161810 n=1 Tax=Lingula anatina TaxID=7574 RepID=A0A1S3I7X1_LINAN|nr:uncharacterized protein LOC106161810 [Lingula anatina]|eukprot:XP_013394293.1 uncharacterized protein LOC106161810 [Lingula anatina]